MNGRRTRRLLSATVVAALAVTVAVVAAGALGAGGATVQAKKTAKFGTVLFAANGKVLYRFTHDAKGKDSCMATAACIKAWPPLTVPTGTKPTAGPGVNAAMLGTIPFKSGVAQVTYGGFPLYFFFKDKDGGDQYGQGLFNAWYVVGTNGAVVKHATKAAAAPAATTGKTTTAPAPAGGGGGGYGGGYGG